MQELKGKRAIVTGASSGIGRAIALEFGKAGAKVLVHYHSNQSEADQVVKTILDFGGEAFSYGADLSQPDECRKLFVEMNQHFGGIDILIANAGIQKDAPFVHMKLEDWKKVIDVNLTGQFICAQEAVRSFCAREKSGSARGVIIFTNSVHQEIPWAGHVNYAASKGGLKLLMESMAQELAAEKIRVNAIAPGAIKTDINREAWEKPEDEKKLLELIPYGRVGVPEDVAKAALWLASDDSDYVVGTTLYIDGGMTLFPAFREGG